MKKLGAFFMLLLLFAPVVLFAQGQLTSVQPSAAFTGEALNVVIQGFNVKFQQNVSTVSFGNDITVTKVEVINTNTLVASVQIGAAAAVGVRDVQVITEGEVVTLPAGFEVLQKGSYVVAQLAIIPAQNIYLADFAPDNIQNAPLLYTVSVFNDNAQRDLQVVLRFASQTYGLIATATKVLDDFQPFETITFNNREFDTYKPANVHYKLEKKALQTGQLPADVYLYSVEIYEGNTVIAEDEGSHTVSNFATQPQPIRPGTQIPAPPEITSETQPLFMWYSDAYHFTFSLYPVYPGQTQGEEVVLNRPVFRQENLTSSELLYPGYAEMLEEGQTYAWQIVAHVPSSHGEQQPASDVFWFTYSPSDYQQNVVADVVVNEQDVTLHLNDTFMFSAIGFDHLGEVIEVNPRWQVFPANAGTVDENGKFIAGTKPGVAAVIAQNGNASDFVTVKISDLNDTTSGIVAATDKHWNIISPAPGATVNSTGELIIEAQFSNRWKLSENTVQVYLNNKILANNVKFSNNRITALYMLPLKPGKHKIEIKAKVGGYRWLDPLVWEFEVVKAETEKITKEYKIKLDAHIFSETRVTGLSGKLKNLRQEPAFTSYNSIEGKASAGKFRFPFRFAYTTEQQNYPQAYMPRNYLFAGVETNRFAVGGGDMNPFFDNLVMSGVRIRGFSAAYTGKRFGVEVVHGTAQQAREGSLEQYLAGEALPPTTLREDSTYLVPGEYKRDITAARIQFGNVLEESVTGINIIRGRDRIESIQYGQFPKDNFVMGLDQVILGADKKYKFITGIAFSSTTQNTATGPSTKHEIDSVFDMDLPIDPLKVKGLYTINYTTTQPQKSSIAAFARLGFNGKWHNTNAEYRYIGASFESFGNPYLRNDVRVLSIEEQLKFFKRKLILQGRLRYEHDNLINQLLATTNAYIYGGYAIVNPGQKWPRLMVNYTGISRKATSELSFGQFMDDNYQMLNANISYTFKTGKISHRIATNATKVTREDLLRPQNSTEVFIMNVSFIEDLKPANLQLQLRYYSMVFSETNIQPVMNTIEGRVSYKLTVKKQDIRMQLLYSTTTSQQREDAYGYNRNRYSASIEGRLNKVLRLKLEGGYNPFEYLLRVDNSSYDEYYFLARLGYDLFVRD